MRTNLGRFEDDYDGRKMRALVAELDRLFAQIRINDQVITGSGYSSGGVTISVNGNIQAAGNLTVDGTTTLTGNLTATSIDVGGGYGSTGITLSSAGNISLDGVLTSSNVTDSSSSITGSVILAGGVGIAKKLYVGSNAVIGGTISVTGHTTFEGVTSTGATGTGKLVYDTAPTLGAITVTSVNKVTITAPTTGATLTIAEGKTFTSSNTLTLTATDGSTLAIGTGGTLGTAAYTASGDYLPVGGTAANASQLLGATWAAPGTIGSGTANTGAFSTLSIGGGTTITKYLSATATWNPGNLGSLGWGTSVSNTSTTVTVTGAALGDIALASFSLDLQGLDLAAYVSAADTVTCVLSNATSAAVNLGSGTLRASVLKH